MPNALWKASSLALALAQSTKTDLHRIIPVPVNSGRSRRRWRSSMYIGYVFNPCVFHPADTHKLASSSILSAPASFDDIKQGISSAVMPDGLVNPSIATPGSPLRHEMLQRRGEAERKLRAWGCQKTGTATRDGAGGTSLKIRLSNCGVWREEQMKRLGS